MPTLSILGVGITGAYWQITGLGFNWASDQYVQAYITVDKGWGSSSPVYPPPPPGSGNSTPLTLFSGLTQDTQYTATGWVQPLNGSPINIGTFPFRTQASPPTALTGLRVTAQGDGYVSLAWNYSTYATSYSITGYGGSTSVGNQNTATIIGLNNGQTYNFTVTPVGPGGTGGSQTVSGKPAYSRPADFYFGYPYNSATLENSLIAQGQPVTNLEAYQWNAFQDRINEFRKYYSNYTPMNPYPFTRASSGGGISADMYNEIRNSMTGMTAVSNLPPFRSRDEDILAADIRKLTAALRGVG